MKQTNNAIKFLLAQYRAIYKHALIKGVLSSSLLTLGLATSVAHSAASPAGENLEWNNIKDKQEVYITGSKDHQIGKTHHWFLSVSGGSGPNIKNNPKAFTVYIAGNDESQANKIQGPVSAENATFVVDTTKHTYEGKSGDAKLTIHGAESGTTLSLKKMDVKNGELVVSGGSTSGHDAILSAKEIVVGSGKSGDVATGKIVVQANSGDASIGFDAKTDATGSIIDVNQYGALVLSGTASGDAYTKGSQLNVNNGGLLVGKGNSKIVVDDLNVKKGSNFVSSGTDSFEGHKATIEGNVLVTKTGNLTLKPKQIVDENDKITELGSVTFKSGSQLQLSGTLTVGTSGATSSASYLSDIVNKDSLGGKLVIEKGANLYATEAADSNKSGSIVVDGGVTSFEPSDTTKQRYPFSAELEIDKDTLANFLKGGQKYKALTYEDDDGYKVTVATTDSSSKQGSVLLASGGLLDIKSDSQVDLNDFYFASGGSSKAVAGAITLSGAALLSAEDLRVSDVLKKSANVETDLNETNKIHLATNSLTLGNSEYTVGQDATGDMKFASATVRDSVTFETKDNKFILGNSLVLDRDYYLKDKDGINSFTQNHVGQILGDDIQLGKVVDSSARSIVSGSGSIDIKGGAWETASDISIVSGSISVGAKSAKNLKGNETLEDDLIITSRWHNNGNAASLKLTGNLVFDGKSGDAGRSITGDKSKATLSVTGALGADAVVDITQASVTFGHGQITVSGAELPVYAFDKEEVRDFYKNPLGHVGYGKLFMTSSQLDDLLNEKSNTALGIAESGYVKVDGSLSNISVSKFKNVDSSEYLSAEISFDEIQSKEVSFVGAGTLHFNGSLSLYDGDSSNSSTASTGLDIGIGTIVADSISIHNYHQDTDGTVAEVNLTGDFIVKNQFSTNSDILNINQNSSIALIADKSDNSGSIVLGENGVINLQNSKVEEKQTSALVVANGQWNTDADINITGEVGQVVVGVGLEKEKGYNASFKADNFASSITTDLVLDLTKPTEMADSVNLFVQDKHMASFNSMQLNENSLVMVGGKLHIAGLAADDQRFAEDSTDVVSSLKDTAGIKFDSGSQFIIAGLGASVEFGKNASLALVKDKEGTIGEGESKFVLDDNLLNTKFNTLLFGELKLDLEGKKISVNDAKYLTSNLISSIDNSGRLVSGQYTGV